AARSRLGVEAGGARLLARRRQQDLHPLLRLVQDLRPPLAQLHPLFEEAQPVLERQVPALEPLHQRAQPHHDLVEALGGDGLLGRLGRVHGRRMILPARFGAISFRATWRPKAKQRWRERAAPNSASPRWTASATAATTSPRRRRWW